MTSFCSLLIPIYDTIYRLYLNKMPQDFVIYIEYYIRFHTHLRLFTTITRYKQYLEMVILITVSLEFTGLKKNYDTYIDRVGSILGKEGGEGERKRRYQFCRVAT